MSMGKHPFPVLIMFWRAMMTYIIVLYIILLGGYYFSSIRYYLQDGVISENIFLVFMLD
jgi:hypothetical protein